MALYINLWVKHVDKFICSFVFLVSVTVILGTSGILKSYSYITRRNGWFYSKHARNRGGKKGFD